MHISLPKNPLLIALVAPENAFLYQFCSASLNTATTRALREEVPQVWYCATIMPPLRPPIPLDQ